MNFHKAKTFEYAHYVYHIRSCVSHTHQSPSIENLYDFFFTAFTRINSHSIDRKWAYFFFISKKSQPVTRRSFGGRFPPWSTSRVSFESTVVQFGVLHSFVPLVCVYFRKYWKVKVFQASKCWYWSSWRSSRLSVRFLCFYLDL